MCCFVYVCKVLYCAAQTCFQRYWIFLLQVGVTTAFALSTVAYNTKEKMMKRNAAMICLVIVTNLVVSGEKITLFQNKQCCVGVMVKK